MSLDMETRLEYLLSSTMITCTHFLPCHICWDLLLCPGAVSPCHDDHFHWPCGEQCSDTVIDIRMRHYMSAVGCIILL